MPATQAHAAQLRPSNILLGSWKRNLLSFCSVHFLRVKFFDTSGEAFSQISKYKYIMYMENDTGI